MHIEEDSKVVMFPKKAQVSWWKLSSYVICLGLYVLEVWEINVDWCLFYKKKKYTFFTQELS